MFRTMRSQSRVESDVKQQLEDIDDHRPFFTYWATTVQVFLTLLDEWSLMSEVSWVKSHERSSGSGSRMCFRILTKSLFLGTLFAIQVVIMIITLAVYGFAPMGFERKLITGTIQTTNLAHEQVYGTWKRWGTYLIDYQTLSWQLTIRHVSSFLLSWM